VIKRILNQPFQILNNKKDRLLLIFIVFVFSLIFLNVFKPFNIHRWFSDSPLVQFLRLSSYGIIVSLVYLFTQFPLRKVLKQETFTLKTYILWLFIEIALISLVYIFLYGNPKGNFINDFIFSIEYTILGIFLPYSFALLIIYYKNQRKEIQLLQNKINQPAENKLLTFKDENEKIKFSVLLQDLLYLESTDNYVSVFYILENKIQRKLVRNTMKNLEEKLKQKSIVRCHRSFMVNTVNIELVQRTGKNIHLKLKHVKDFIPVSQKYSSRFLAFLS